MSKGLRLAFTGSLAGLVAATAIPSDALAGPTGVAAPSTVELSAPVDRIWYRRWGGGYGWRRGYYRPYYGGYYRRYNPGAAVAAGVGLGLLGAGLAAANSGYYYGGYYPYYNYGYGYYPYNYYYPSYGYWGW